MKNRLKEIYDSASKLFINRGYSRTQIKDIAKDIGLSTGMIYVYFTSKADILNFTLKATIEPEFLDREFELPLSSHIFDDVENEIKKALDQQEKNFASVLIDVDNDPFQTMLSSTFDIIAKYGTGILIIEKNPDDVGELDGYYRKYRKRFFDQMLEYIKYFQSIGVCRTLKHTEYSTQLIIETLAWWGMHMMNDAYITQKDIDFDVAKETCMDNLINAYRAD